MDEQNIPLTQCYQKSNKFRDSEISSWSLNPKNKLTSMKQNIEKTLAHLSQGTTYNPPMIMCFEFYKQCPKNQLFHLLSMCR